ncbi:beta-N-acetylhexosaminidase [Amorphoplanes nipponensis]|uniref:beta-N-acetylhexosaminidase n=1 Tax=Actinoplanes nipponensis TaxID=135950 RepID=A0A919JFY5_9ACTN|nr:beta-N-acetylhexosaminidase [Actinoplanes nipponensis]GIE48312.1 beta-N-acetylhexosaminidase [Actinoplanes nipponensis]
MIPRPESVAYQPGVFVLRPGTPVVADPGLAGVAAWLRGLLPAGRPADTPGRIRLRLDTALAAEGYVLTVGAGGIDIRGGSPAGAHYGVQTLRQLLPARSLRRAPVSGDPLLVPAVHIEDAPRFGWRGVLLDVARHFMPVADVLRFVDLAAFHKLNVLHLHLTDDQGWRIEVPGRPRLTTVGAWRPRTMLGSRIHGRYDDRPHGGYYTADDLREIVAYAAERQVTVLPEVDMPGHMQAAVAAYPELGNGFAGGVRTSWGISPHVLNLSDAALDFCREVLDHVCAIFPGELIGIGGDECPVTEWDTPAARARIAAEGLAGPHEAQGWFTARIAEHLAARGRRVHGWDEILAGGAPAGATIAAWRGAAPAVLAARAGHDVVSCPDTAVYLDYRQSDDPGEPTPVGTLLTLADVYAFEPVPPGLTGAAADRVIGGQANVWTEHLESARRVDYQVYPRLCAFAETVWGPPDRDYADFTDRLGPHLARLDALGVNYRPPSGPRPGDARPDAPGHPRELADRLAEVHEMTADLRR